MRTTFQGLRRVPRVPVLVLVLVAEQHRPLAYDVFIKRAAEASLREDEWYLHGLAWAILVAEPSLVIGLTCSAAVPAKRLAKRG